MQLQHEKHICKSNLLRKCGLLAHTSPTFLKNCWIKKLLFACGSFFERSISAKAMFHMKQIKNCS